MENRSRSSEIKQKVSVAGLTLLFLGALGMTSSASVEAESAKTAGITSPATLRIDKVCMVGNGVAVRWQDGIVTQASTDGGVAVESAFGKAVAIDANLTDNMSVSNLPSGTIQLGGDCIKYGVETVWSNGMVTQASIGRDGIAAYQSGLGNATEMGPASTK